MTNQEADKIRKYLAVLGLPENAGLKELREAYHQKAAILHPDKQPDDHVRIEAFKKVNVAYEHLKKHFRNAAKNKQLEPVTPVQYSMDINKKPTAATMRQKHDTPDITVDELIFRLKHSQNKYVRIHAIKELEKHGCKEAAWALLPSLGDFEEEVALCSAGALGRMGARIATVPLINLYKKSSPSSRKIVVEALSSIGSPMAMNFLAKITPARKYTSSNQGTDSTLPSFFIDKANA